jgi:hypothetical protein
LSTEAKDVRDKRSKCKRKEKPMAISLVERARKRMARKIKKVRRTNSLSIALTLLLYNAPISSKICLR